MAFILGTIGIAHIVAATPWATFAAPGIIVAIMGQVIPFWVH